MWNWEDYATEQTYISIRVEMIKMGEDGTWKNFVCMCKKTKLSLAALATACAEKFITHQGVVRFEVWNLCTCMIANLEGFNSRVIDKFCSRRQQHMDFIFWRWVSIIFIILSVCWIACFGWLFIKWCSLHLI